MGQDKEKRKSKKRKVKTLNTSKESENKIHLNSTQSAIVIPRISNSASSGTMEPTLSTINSTLNAGIVNGTPQHPSSSVQPGIQPNMQPALQFQSNQLQPYMPPSPRSQFAGYLSPIQNQPNDVSESLSLICNKLEYLSNKLNTLDQIDKRLSDLERNVCSVNHELQEMKTMKTKVEEIEKGMTFISQQYDCQQKAVKEIERTVKEIDKKSTVAMKENETMRDDLQVVRSELKELSERHLDLQTRSMRDNLVFDGIPETLEEDAEQVLKNFIKDELNITDDIEFHRVHRMGRKGGPRHRPIVAKFVMFKDRERVRRAAPGSLMNKPYGINEQFPKEINERRKRLYPHYKAAKRQGKRATLVADKLFIEGQLIQLQTTQLENQPGITPFAASNAAAPPPQFAHPNSRNANSH